MATAKEGPFEHSFSQWVPVLLATVAIGIWLLSFKYTAPLMEAGETDILAGHKGTGPDPNLDPEGRYYWRGLLPIHYFLALGFAILSITVLARSLSKGWAIVACLIVGIFLWNYYSLFPTNLHGNLASKMFVEATCKGEVETADGKSKKLKEFSCVSSDKYPQETGPSDKYRQKIDYGKNADFFQKYERFLDRLAIFLFVFAAYGTAVPFVVWRKIRMGNAGGAGCQYLPGWVKSIVCSIACYFSLGPGDNQQNPNEASFLVNQMARLQKLLFGGAALMVLSIVSLAAMFRWLASFYPSPLASGKILGLALLDKIPKPRNLEAWDDFWQKMEELNFDDWGRFVESLKNMVETFDGEISSNQLQNAIDGLSSAHLPILGFGMGYTMYWGVMFTFVMLLAILPPMIILRNRSYELAYRTLQKELCKGDKDEKNKKNNEDEDEDEDGITIAMVREWLDKHQLSWGLRFRLTSLTALFSPLLFGSAMPFTQALL